MGLVVVLFGFRLVWMFGLNVCLACCILVLFVDCFLVVLGLMVVNGFCGALRFGWCWFD